MMTESVEKEVLGHVLIDSLTRAREWQTGGHARYLKKAFDLQMKEFFVRKMQKGARAMVARLRVERNRQQQMRSDCSCLPTRVLACPRACCWICLARALL